MSRAKVEQLISATAFAVLALLPFLLAVSRAGADIGVCIIDVLFVAHTLLSKDSQWLTRPEMKTLGMLWGFMVVVSFATPINPISAFKAALIWGRFVLFFAAARFWLLTSPEALRKVMIAGLVTIALACIDTAWQYKTGVSLTGHGMIGSDRLTGPLTKANIGNYLLKVGFPMIGMLAYLLLERGQSRRLWIPAVFSLAVISLIMVSGERSTPILMLLSFGIIGLITLVCNPKARKWVFVAGAAIVALLALLAATQPIVLEKTKFFIAQISDFWNTPYGQLYIAAWKLWKQHPITGIGDQQFLDACKPTILNVTYCDVHPHNMYFEWLVAAGLPGILLLLLSLALILRRFLKHAPFIGTASVLTAFGLSEFAVIVFPFVVTQSVFANWSAVLYWYSLSLGMSLLALANNKEVT